jgi:hypothetical protein
MAEGKIKLNSTKHCQTVQNISPRDYGLLEVIVSATSIDMTYKGIGVVSSLP